MLSCIKGFLLLTCVCSGASYLIQMDSCRSMHKYFWTLTDTLKYIMWVISKETHTLATLCK
jgi:hypothetical protein